MLQNKRRTLNEVKKELDYELDYELEVLEDKSNYIHAKIFYFGIRMEIVVFLVLVSVILTR